MSTPNRDIRNLTIVLLTIVAALCVATAIFLPQLQAATHPDLVLNKILKKNADCHNKKCPRNMNAELRLDGYEAGNKTMTIRYTLLKVNSTEVNGSMMRPSVSRQIREGICREKWAAELMKKGAAFVFAVHGHDGGLIFDYQVKHEDCES